MELESAEAVTIFAAAHLRVGARRLRLLASGQDPLLQEWLTHDSAQATEHARAYARKTALRLQSLGAGLITLRESDYPAGLRQLLDPPPFLTYQGTIGLAGVAIVGSRTPPVQALEFAFEVARHLGGATISGLALGIDAAVHRGSLSVGLPTLAYVGNGICQTYPPEHARLRAELIASGGGIASEQLPEEEVSLRGLVRRDRLQAAHAQSVLLVCSEAGGGALHAMRCARDLRKPRFAVEQNGPAYGGNREAIESGATPVDMHVDPVVHQLRAVSTK